MFFEHIADLFDGNKPKSAVRNGTLTLCLTNAATPVVWRLDMRQVSASALEIRKSEDKEAPFTLVLKSPKADIHDIARFTKREDALKALKSVMRAIEKADFTGEMPGKQHTKSESEKIETGAIPNNYFPPAKKGKGPWLAFFLGMFFFLVIIIGFVLVAPGPGDQRAGFSPAGQQNMNSLAPGAAGQPQSADQFLQGR